MQHIAIFWRISIPAIRFDLLSASIFLVFLWGWHWRVVGYLSPAAGASIVFFLVICFAFGNIFTRLIAPYFQGVPGLVFQILTGYFVFNSLLFLTALASPLGMAINLAILSVIALLGLVLLRKRVTLVATAAEQATGCLAVLISCLGATIWCGDAQSPELRDGHVIFRVFYDMYIHAREISVFAQAHGLTTVQDIKLSGGRAPIYHFASYLSPAAISTLSGASAMDVYASLQLPLGITLTGLAAYCFMGKVFGLGPGIAATVAIIALPDAYQQGFQNRYLSYNFMAQINLGMLYGIACVAVAWMFMIEGCRRGKYGAVLLSYIFLALCMMYKAHLFVANSYVLMMFPFLFFTPVRRAWRLGLGVVATMIFFLAVSYAQNNPRVPVMRFDGSGISPYLVLLLKHYDAGWAERFFHTVLIREKHSLPIQALYACALLGLSTFGLWLAGLTVMLAKTWRQLPAVVWLFPVIVVGNYLIMALGLALDNRKIGEPEELVNRPLVWAYFAVAAWTAAVAYRSMIGEGLPRGRGVPVAMVLLVLCFGITMRIAPNLQTFPRYDFLATYDKQSSVPVCLVKASDYLRQHSPKSDVVQDVSFDPRFSFTALSERQLYVGNGVFGGVKPDQQARLRDVTNLVRSSDANEIQQFFSSRGIDWFLQRPNTILAWPMASLPQPVFDCGGFKLFHFVRSVSKNTISKTTSIAKPAS